MLSTEKSLFSPWPTVSSLSLSTWPAPESNSDSSTSMSINNQIVQTKKQWKKNFVPNFTSSSEASPTFQSFDNFTFDESKDVQINSIDQIAAQLLNLSDQVPDLQDHVEVRRSEVSGAEVRRPVNTPSPNTTDESDINLPVTSSSNPRFVHVTSLKYFHISLDSGLLQSCSAVIDLMRMEMEVRTPGSRLRSAETSRRKVIVCTETSVSLLTEKRYFHQPTIIKINYYFN